MWSLCLEKQEAGVGDEDGGGGRVGSPSWNLTVVTELQPRAFSGPRATAVSQLPSPSLGPLDPPRGLQWEGVWAEWEDRHLQTVGRGRGAFCLYLHLFGQSWPGPKPRRREGGGAIVLGKSPWGEGESWGGKG